ncbi:MAG: GTP cyclohydrolase I FolE [Planctomycetota bacterium]|nr:GTP cyclohydrolase I FolE [Planctomycetota bacterium]
MKTSELVRILLENLGEDPTREGLLRTPERVERSMAELTQGARQTVQEVVGQGVFEEDCSEMVVVKDIEFYSLCEHHLLPFFGRVHVAYIPNKKIIGLSKLPRIVDVFARRLQVQERMTVQIAEAIQQVLQPKGVGVVADASHLCMMMRGVQKQNSSTMTSCLLGTFRSDFRTRSEFLGLVRSIPH